jgi:putative DNA methylase
MTTIRTPKKLIEVTLPLDDINAAAARAVLFAQLVNDPGYQREIGFGVNKKSPDQA